MIHVEIQQQDDEGIAAPKRYACDISVIKDLSGNILLYLLLSVFSALYLPQLLGRLGP